MAVIQIIYEWFGVPYLCIVCPINVSDCVLQANKKILNLKSIYLKDVLKSVVHAFPYSNPLIHYPFS